LDLEVGTTLGTTLAFACGYLVGSVPLGLLVSKGLYGLDIRRYGTRGTGASNVLHNIGLVPAAVVGLGIFLQGLAPPLVVRLLGGSEVAVAAAALGAVVGYDWPVFLGFKAAGARGVGVSTGAAVVLFPLGAVPLLAMYALGKVLRQMASGVLLGFVAYAAGTFFLDTPPAVRSAAVLLLGLIVLRRLEGVGQDLARGDLLPVLANRLLFDRRPGQHLSGPVGPERERQSSGEGQAQGKGG
jgi:glycerol-3-phosphate acyltransferase PlsY